LGGGDKRNTLIFNLWVPGGGKESYFNRREVIFILSIEKVLGKKIDMGNWVIKVVFIISHQADRGLQTQEV